MQKRMTVPEALEAIDFILKVSHEAKRQYVVVSTKHMEEVAETLHNYHHVIGELVNVLSEKIGE